MEGWNTRRTNEAAERSERDAAMRIIGAQDECARIRRELLAWADEFVRRGDYMDGFRAALDHTCPEEK